MPTPCLFVRPFDICPIVLSLLLKKFFPIFLFAQSCSRSDRDKPNSKPFKKNASQKQLLGLESFSGVKRASFGKEFETLIKMFLEERYIFVYRFLSGKNSPAVIFSNGEIYAGSSHRKMFCFQTRREV